MLGRIFISYRRADSQYATDRIYERLADVFGEECVFMDIDDIPLGVNFRDYIDQQVSTSSIVLAVIGDHWLDARDVEENRRLENPSDFVRLELEAALKLGIKLIPVFIGDVKAIPTGKLPASLQELPMLNATRIRRGKDFLPDVDRLIRGIEKISKEQDARREKNKAYLAELKQSAAEIKLQLSQLEALMIQETRKRARLEKQAQKIEQQVDSSLLDPGKVLLVDVSVIQQEIEKISEGLYELALQIEDRKQGRAPEDQFYQDDLPREEVIEVAEDAAPEPAKPVQRPKPKPRQVKAAKPKPDLNPVLTKIPVWLWGAAAVVVIGVILGVIFGPDLYRSISSSRAPTSQPTHTAELADPSSDDQNQQSSPDLLSVNPGVINWIYSIFETTPAFIEDFSIPQAYWNNQDRGINQANYPGNILEGIYRIVVDSEDEQETGAGKYPFGSDALFQFEVTPLQIERNYYIWVSFRETYNTGYSFSYHASGDWELVNFSNNLQTVLVEGTSNQLESGQTYNFQVFAYHKTIVVLLNQQPLLYEIDNTYSEGSASIAFVSQGGMESELDNIQIWDLSEILMYADLSESHNVSAKDFYSPIREYLAATPPTNEDDFEAYREYWEEMQVNFSDTKPVELAELVKDGEVRLNSIDDLKYNNFELNFPDLIDQTHYAFAVQYDFRFNEPGSSNPATSVDTTWGPEDNYEHYSAYCDFYQDSQEIWCGLYELNDSGKFLELSNRMLSLYKNMHEAFTFLAIFHQGQFALFLDGYFMGYAENLDLVEQQIRINFGNGNPNDEFELYFDNLKYWDLSGVEIGEVTQPEEEDSAFDYERILAIIAAELPPDFEDDFSEKKADWGSTSEGLLIYPLVNNGNLYITDYIDIGNEGMEDDHAVSGVRFPINGLFNAGAFLLEFDFSFNSPFGGTPREIGIQFGELDQNSGYKFYFRNTGVWIFEQEERLANGSYNVEGLKRVRMLVYNRGIAVILDDKLVHVSEDLSINGTRNAIYLSGDHGDQAVFDDFKFWNLDGVDLEDFSN